MVKNIYYKKEFLTINLYKNYKIREFFKEEFYFLKINFHSII
jgi:hypothetical protein